MYSFKYSQQDASYTIFFIAVSAVHVSGGKEYCVRLHLVGYT
jgi:hypothetical protein